MRGDRKRHRRKWEAHVRLHIWFLKSPAWLSLTAAERAVYIQLASRYNGCNNGKIAFSVRDAARECKISKNTAAQAFKALVKTGFIEIKTPGGFSRKVRHAAEWLLTEFRDDVSGQLPKKTFMLWQKI